MKPFAIAGIQMYLGHGSNVEAMRHRVDLTMHLYPWVQMVMFSELAVFGPMLQHAQPLPGTVEEAFRVMARHHGIWLVNGSMYERRDGGIYNTSSIINPEGEIVGRYSKMFPFTPLEQGVQPGKDFFVGDLDVEGRAVDTHDAVRTGRSVAHEHRAEQREHRQTCVVERGSTREVRIHGKHRDGQAGEVDLDGGPIGQRDARDVPLAVAGVVGVDEDDQAPRGALAMEHCDGLVFRGVALGAAFPGGRRA